MTSIAGEVKESTIRTIINNNVDIDSGVQYRPIKDCKYDFGSRASFPSSFVRPTLSHHCLKLQLRPHLIMLQ